MVIVGSWGCMFYWCMFYVWENDVNNKTMTASELADRIKRGEKWQIDESELKKTEDRKILELAAKAAGIEYTWTKEGFLDGEEGIVPDGWRRCWNPLADDGDALRLAVKLGLTLVVESDMVFCRNQRSDKAFREQGKDPYAATRRAIVRAAAKIGESL